MRRSNYNFAITPQEGRDRNLHLQTMGVSSRVSRFKLPEPAVIYEDAYTQHGYPYITIDMQHQPLVAPLDSFAAFASAFGQDGTDSGITDAQLQTSLDTGQFDSTDPAAGAPSLSEQDLALTGDTVSTAAPAPSGASSAISDIFSNVLKAATPVAQSAVTAAIIGRPPPVQQGVPVGAQITGPGGTILRPGVPSAAPKPAVSAGILIAAVAGVGLLLAMSGGGGSK